MSRRRSIFGEGSGRDPEPQDEPVFAVDLVDQTGQVGRARRKVIRVLAMLVPIVPLIVAGVVFFARSANNAADSTPVPSISIDIPSLDFPSLDIFGTLKLKVGDCFQYPASTGPASTGLPDLTSVQPVACSTPHTAQLYALDPADGQCSQSGLNSGALPPNAQYDTVVVLDDGGAQIACVVRTTTATTGSVMAP